MSHQGKTTMENKIVIALATDRKYRYYTGVTLYSLLQHTAPDTNYEILLLEENLTEEDLAIFSAQITGKNNISLTVIDMRSKIREIGADKFYTGTYAIPIFYRLFLPEMLPQYDKVLYLDSDIIVQSDIQDLYFMDIGGAPLAAGLDIGASSIPLNLAELNAYWYCRRVLGLRKSNRYFNSGVLIMDLQKLRNSDYPQRIRAEISSSSRFGFPDQDILNRIFDGKVFYLDKTWNYMILRNGRHLEKYSILHFAGVHPWLSIHLPHSEIWWESAEKALLAEKIRKENYGSPEQMQYLEGIDRSYRRVVNSPCWRYTALFRKLKNLTGFIGKCISNCRTAYK